MTCSRGNYCTAGCGRHFFGLRAFERHFLPSGQCASDRTLIRKGFHKDARGWWRENPRPRGLPGIARGAASARGRNHEPSGQVDEGSSTPGASPEPDSPDAAREMGAA